jgi:hypothetical protein
MAAWNSSRASQAALRLLFPVFFAARLAQIGAFVCTAASLLVTPPCEK